MSQQGAYPGKLALKIHSETEARELQEELIHPEIGNLPHWLYVNTCMVERSMVYLKRSS